MEKRKYSRNLRFITALFVVATISSSGAQAAMPALESGGETSLSPTLSRPTPQPGVVATPSAIMESTPGNERSFIGPVIEAVEVGFINRANGTAGLLEGPRTVVANIGGYGQIVPTLATVARNATPIIAGVLQIFMSFGASA